MMLPTTEIERPKIDISLFGTDSTIPPIDRVHMMDEDTFELFTMEWLYGSKKGQYKSILRIGGAGDKGRDVIGEYNDGTLDYYQCKQYSSPLAPSEYYVEIGKLCYYTYSKEIPMPKKYFIIASHDVGSTLQNLLNNPSDFKKKLIDNWESHCKTKITKSRDIELDSDFLQYIDSFDFGIIECYPIAKIIDEHLQSIYGNIRFGGQHLHQPESLSPCQDIQQEEMTYVTALLEAYSDELGIQIENVSALESHPKFFSHFSRQRKDYYKAETIRRFVRDTLTDSQQYDVLKNEVYDGIIETHEKEYGSGYERLIADLQQAGVINTGKCLLDSKLHFIGNGERKGVCHVLANERRLRWVDKPYDSGI